MFVKGIPLWSRLAFLNRILLHRELGISYHDSSTVGWNAVYSKPLPTKISRVAVPIFLDTNPYSLKTGNMDRNRVPDTQRVHQVSGPVFSLNWTFSGAWNIRYPDTSLKHGVSRLVNVFIFLDLPRIMECSWRTLQFLTPDFLPLNFTKIHAADCVILICTLNVHETWRFHAIKCDQISWCVKFPVFTLARNSMVGEIPDGSWNYQCSKCGETSWYAKVSTLLVY